MQEKNLVFEDEALFNDKNIVMPNNSICFSIHTFTEIEIYLMFFFDYNL